MKNKIGYRVYFKDLGLALGLLRIRPGYDPYFEITETAKIDREFTLEILLLLKEAEMALVPLQKKRACKIFLTPKFNLGLLYDGLPNDRCIEIRFDNSTDNFCQN